MESSLGGLVAFFHNSLQYSRLLESNESAREHNSTSSTGTIDSYTDIEGKVRSRS